MVVVMLSGCVDYRASRITATTGVTMAWVGGGLLVLGAVVAETKENSGGGVLGLFVLGAGIAVPGVILWLSGRGFMALHESPAEQGEH